MTLRFRTAFANDRCAYAEGHTIEVPTPLPTLFKLLLERGIVDVLRDDGQEFAVPDPLMETAVTRHRSRGSGRRARSSVSGVARA